MSKVVTVLTTVYNRKDELIRLFSSLQNQSIKQFDWLIVDDGSTDELRTTVSKFAEESEFIINYLYKENGGKHTALNYSYEYITTPLTIIVDSDDMLTSNAIETIIDTYKKNKEETGICGYSFLRGKPHGGLWNKTTIPYEGLTESFVECRINRSISGDMAEVWYTHCLREYPFPVFENERFLGEDTVWVKMSEKYKLKYYNKVIYISDYYGDGLTMNRRKNNIKSPKGCVERANVFLESDSNLKAKIKPALQYQVYGRIAKYSLKDLFNKTNEKILFVLFYLPAKIVFKVWTKKYNIS